MYKFHNEFVLIIFACILILAVSCSDKEKKNKPKAIKGVIDLTNWDFKKYGEIKLHGMWKFKWLKNIITYSKINYKDENWDYITHIPHPYQINIPILSNYKFTQVLD